MLNANDLFIGTEENRERFALVDFTAGIFEKIDVIPAIVRKIITDDWIAKDVADLIHRHANFELLGLFCS